MAIPHCTEMSSRFSHFMRREFDPTFAQVTLTGVGIFGLTVMNALSQLELLDL
jgi:hypothetical protein